MSQETDELNAYIQKLYEGEIRATEALDKSLLQVASASAAGIFAVYGINDLKPVDCTGKVLLLLSLIAAAVSASTVLWSYWRSANIHNQLRTIYEKVEVRNIEQGREKANEIMKNNRIRMLNLVSVIAFMTCLIFFAIYSGIRFFS